MLGLLGLLATAQAAPDRVAAESPTSTPVIDLATSSDGSWVAWITQAGQLALLDTTSWDVWEVSHTSGSAATGGVALGGTDTDPRLVAGLANGSLGLWKLVYGSNPIEFGSIATGSEATFLAADSTTVFAVVETEENGPSIGAWNLSDGASVFTELTDLSGTKVVDFGARRAADEAGGSTISMLYALHGSYELSRVTSEGAVSTGTENEGSHELENVWVVAGGSTVWFADSGGVNSLGYLGSDTSEIDISFTSSPDLGDTYAVGGLYADDDGWIGISNADAVYIHAYEGSTAVGSELAVLPELAGATAVAGIEGYGFVGGDVGVSVITDRPWVTIESISTSSVASGDSIDVTFSSDTSGTYKLRYGNVETGPDPSAVTEGEVTANESTTFTFELDAGDDPGDARFVLEVAVTANNLEGHDSRYVYVDNPPDGVELTSDNVLYGDQSVRLLFDALDEDVAQSYRIYLSTVPFQAEDYPTGGPDYEGPDDVPASFSDTPENGVVDCVIGGLTNDTPYYVAVRAIDVAEDGTEAESEMSDVFVVTPRETYAVSERLGIESWCGLPLTSAGWLGVGLAMWGATRRRRGGGKVALGGLAMLAALVVPSAAQAKPHEDDLTDRSFNFELRYGPFLTQESSALTENFGSVDNRLLRAELGWTSNFVEVDFGFGLWSDEGGQTDDSGTVSGDEDKLTAVPLSLDATLRLDIWKEQPVVPFVRAGGDFWLWNETWQSAYDSSGGGETTAGTVGVHWGAGLAILLDPIDPGAASQLETLVGVNDTYLVAEYRQTYSLDMGEPYIDFSSTDLTIGLKFDF